MVLILLPINQVIMTKLRNYPIFVAKRIITGAFYQIILTKKTISLRIIQFKMPKTLILLLLAIAIQCSGQYPAYRQITVADGLPSNQIYCGIQDHQGFIWMGTDKGLVRYDGTNFRLFTVQDGLPDPEVIHINEDRQGRIWLSCFGKEICYFKDGKFSYPIPNQIRNWNAGIVSEVDDDLFLSNIGRLPYLFKNDTATLCTNFSNTLYSIDKINHQTFGFGRYEIFKIVNNQTIPEYKLPISPFGGLLGLCVLDNYVIYSYINVTIILCWDGHHWSLVKKFSLPVGRVFKDKQDNIWICSTESGALCYQFNSDGTLLLKNHLLSGHKVNWMFEDREGSIWIGTTDEGVFIFRMDAPTTFTPAYSANVQIITPTNKGGVWVGNDEGYIEQLGTNDAEIIHLGHRIGLNRIKKILLSDNQVLWAATDGGIFKIEGTKRTGKLLHNAVKDLLMLRDTVWVGTSDGLFRINPHSFDVEPIIAHTRVSSLGTDQDGRLWLGGIEGLYHADDNFQYNWGDQFPVLNDRIVAIESAGSNLIWVVTAKNNLVMAKTIAGKIVETTVVNQYLSHPIIQINDLYVADEHVWLATNTGLFGLDRNWNFRHINQFDGLIHNEVKSVCVQNDTLWAGTLNGVSRFLLKPTPKYPDWDTRIISLSYLNEQRDSVQYFYAGADTLKSALLPNNAQLVRLSCAALQFAQQGKILYRYRILPVFTEWYYLTLDNLFTLLSQWRQVKPDIELTGAAHFSLAASLAPGRLKVEVSAFTIDGSNSHFSDSIILTVKPKWYQTVWFWIAIWSTIAGFIMIVWRYHHNLRELEVMTTNLRLQALRLQINPHFIGNSIHAIQQFFYPPDPIRANAYIAAFNRLLRATMHFSERSLITFQDELDYISDYLDMIKWRLGDRFTYEIVGNEHICPNTPFPCMLLQPVLENATQHGLASEGVSVLQVKFSQNNDILTCQIIDNGPGMSKPDPRRLSKGLTIFKQKIETLNRVYHLKIQLKIEDRYYAEPIPHGLSVIIQYNIKQAQTAWRQHHRIDP
jgi:ligand-binding sensor domain-containing protein